jgi:hypothetical protein
MVKKQDAEMLEEYDFSKGVRGKYAEKYKDGANILKLDEDVAALFPDSKAVNDALRALGVIIEQHARQSRTQTSSHRS